ncbi:Rop family plasmid primer RNA-binding protein [Escherichia coli]|uniref:Rop family plasmid primer RNA-binding protein n=2 Tax=Enterobacteriaceae TaxID=543 RepID=UPI00386022A7
MKTLLTSGCTNQRGAGQLDLDNEADLCEKLHEGAEDLYRVLSARLNVCRDSA